MHPNYRLVTALAHWAVSLPLTLSKCRVVQDVRVWEKVFPVLRTQCSASPARRTWGRVPNFYEDVDLPAGSCPLGPDLHVPVVGHSHCALPRRFSKDGIFPEEIKIRSLWLSLQLGQNGTVGYPHGKALYPAIA